MLYNELSLDEKSVASVRAEPLRHTRRAVVLPTVNTRDAQAHEKNTVSNVVLRLILLHNNNDKRDFGPILSLVI